MPGTGDAASGSSAARPSLEAVLAEARGFGFLGPGPLDQQILHARGFVDVARGLFDTPPRLVDMGSGGGVPGLVVAHEWAEVSLVLLEANERRSTFLRRAVEQLQLGQRVSVLQERAEISGRSEEYRAGFDGAIARSFGRPAVLAECTAPLLKVGGWIVVSEPPSTPAPSIRTSGAPSAADDHPRGRVGGPAADERGTGTTATGSTGDPGESPRWPAEGLDLVGLEPGELVHAGFDYQLLRQVEPCPERYPRRNGVPAKKPLF